jgi:hypothetical protein
MKKRISILILFLIPLTLSSQDYRQTVRGHVIDKESHCPVPYAAVQLINTSYRSNILSDIEGRFKLEYVPVGRISIQVSCLGYQPITIPNLEVTSGTELVVNIEMTESVVELQEVSIKAFRDKDKPLNTFAPVSARTFSVEESQRYAGSANDVSRMAMNFAGVNMSTETSNEIVIRGNSPVGVLFRLDGVDIPNPSHYGDGGSTGGPISMLNNNVLANSDFLTGAFPAEYSNCISGVFDLRMRNGNNEKHEFLVQTGLNGFEGDAEGPLSKKGNASYLINYRYSTVSILRAVGIDVMGNAITDYQDLSFRFNFPSGRIGNIALFGFSGKSYMKMFDSERDTTVEHQDMAYPSDYEMDILYDNYTGAVGLTHSLIISNRAYTKLILSATTIRNHYLLDSLSVEDRKPIPQYFSDFFRTKYGAKFYLNNKFNSRNNLRSGVSAEFRNFNLLDSILVPVNGEYRILRNYRGKNLLCQAFMQYQHKFSAQLQVSIGLNSLLLLSANKLSLEPRAGFRWEFLPNHSFNLGYGLHSMAVPVEVIQQEYHLNNTTVRPNTKLDFMQSQHFILGYDVRLTPKIRLKSELYYQYLSGVPVEIIPSSYSFLNRGAYTVVDVNALKSKGTGYNYGLEITAEKFMDHGAYFLSTLSLFQSRYKGSDGILRNTAFDINYVFNLLGGKEFEIHHKRRTPHFIQKIVLDGKVHWAGGQRYSPIDLEASVNAGKTVFDDSRAFTEQLQDYFRLDFRIAYKWIGRHSSQELALDIQNLTDRENPFYIRFNPESGEVETTGMGIMPDIVYRIRF